MMDCDKGIAMMKIRVVTQWLAVLVLAVGGVLSPSRAGGESSVVIPVYTKDSPPAQPGSDDLPLKDSISQYGITWTLDKPVRAGQFINGDWYVVGSVTVQRIDPEPLFGDEVKTAPDANGKCTEKNYPGQYARNGSTLNMPAVSPPNKISKRTALSGFDSRMPMDAYDPGQFTRLPIAMQPGDSLVSSISREPYDGYPIGAVAILTCMAQPQPPDAFRPSFCRTAACKLYLARNLRRDLLLNLPAPDGAAKIRPQNYSACFQAPWIDTVYSGRAMGRKPFQFWGAQIAEIVGGSSLLLMLDYTPAEKEPLLVNMVQAGIDLYGLVRGGAGWPGEGGGAAGRKWPIIFAGLLLDDPEMAAVTKTFPEARFHEDEQTVFGPVVFNGRTYQGSWTGAKVIWAGHYAYYKGQFRNQEGRPLNNYSPVDLIPPAEWPGPWNEGSEAYRRNSTSAAWVAQALAARLMHAEKFWDHDAFFAYVDRWMTEDDDKCLGEILKNTESKLAAAETDADKDALTDAVTKIKAANRQGTITGRPEIVPVVKALWNKYRNNLPPAPDGVKTPPGEITWKANGA